MQPSNFLHLCSTWPTAYIVGYVSLFRETFLIFRDGKTYCTTVYSTLDPPLFTIPIAETDPFKAAFVDSPLPASYWSTLGVPGASTCKQWVVGIPSENVAVLSLTQTVTSKRASLSVSLDPSTTLSDLISVSLSGPEKPS